MIQLAPVFDPPALEEEARGVWKTRQLPPTGGPLGPRSGPEVLLFEGVFTVGESEGLTSQRAIAADVDARYLALAGRRVLGTLRFEGLTAGDEPPTIAGTLTRLGVWVGGDGTTPWDRADRHARVEFLTGQLARRGVIVSRDLPLRSCPKCAAPRCPEAIIYQEEDGDTYLVRFELSHDGKSVQALVWVDAPWRLLGTSALLVHPDLPYVIARYRRKESEELVFTSRSSIDRFRAWMPDASFEVVEEHPGRYFEGWPYNYPLRHEFPTGGGLTAPGGTVLAVPDVSDTGTGVVPLVPGHGSTDALIAETRGVTGWPLITPRGQLDLTLMHKYSGLDVGSGSEFIVRDLTESDAVFARLRVHRGVPHCALCGSPLVWLPGRAWCLEPGRLPGERLELYRRLLPGDPPLDRVEVVPWPVSDTQRRDDPRAVALLECSQCERLDALNGSPACSCGGRRYPVRRLLLPSPAGALAAWARLEPFPFADSVHLYVAARRRVPSVVHHLMAMTGLEGIVGDVGLTLLPTLPDSSLPELIDAHGADAVRAAFTRTGGDQGTGASLADRCRVERDRLRRWYVTTKEVLALCDTGMIASFVAPIGGFLEELEVEDRALLARWERARVLALASYDRWKASAAYQRVVRFLENDLAVYRAWIRPRLALPGTPPTKRSALRTCVHVLRQAAMLLGPVVPHTAEAIFRRLDAGRTSLFEGTMPAVDRALLNDELAAAWNRWSSVIDSMGRFRRENGILPDAVVPTVALIASQDELGTQLRSDRPVLERLARIGRVAVGSPREPWEGRQRRFRPVESEIQRLYPSQAAQIIHLLGRSPARKLDGSGPAEPSVVIQGESLRVFPSMVEYVDTLPRGVVPQPWPLGEMYVTLPAGAALPKRVAPPLSVDAFWLVRRLDRRNRREPPSPSDRPRAAIIQSSEPLLTELHQNVEAIAKYLEVAEVRVTPVGEGPAAARGISGRTRAGAVWRAQVPGWTSAPRPPKHRPSRPRSRRVPNGSSVPTPVEVDYAAESLVERSQSVRALGSELDAILGAPLLGPTKLSGAWDAGLTSIAAYRSASYEQLEMLPGFGPAVANLLAEKLGGTTAPHRARPLRSSEPLRQAGGQPGRATVQPLIAPSLPSTSAPIANTSARASLPGEPGAGGEEIPRASDLAPTPAPKDLPPSSEVRSSSTDETQAGTTVPGVTTSPEVSTPPSPPEAPSTPDTEEPSTATGLEAPGPAEPIPSATVTDLEANERPTEDEPPPEPAPVAELTPVAEPSTSAQGELPAEPSGTETAGTEPPPEMTESPSTEPAEETSGAPLAELPRPTDELSPEGVGPLIPESPLGEPPGAEAAKEEVAPAMRESMDETVTESSAAGPMPETELAPVAPEEEQVDAGPRVEEPAPVGPVSTVPVEAVTPPSEPIPESPAGEPPVSAEELTPISPESTVPEEEAPESPVPLEEATPPAPVDRTEAQPSMAGPEASAESGTVSPPVSEPEEASPGEEGVPAPPVAAPTPEPPAALPEPPRAGIEIQIGASLLSSIQPFLDATAAGHRGICVVRESPERLQAQVGSRPVDVYWLSNVGRAKSLKPNDLAGVFAFLDRSAEIEHVSVFFLEGVEYLIRIHGAEAVVQRLVELDRRTKELDARVWIHLNSVLLRAEDLAQLVMYFGPRMATG